MSFIISSSQPCSVHISKHKKNFEEKPNSIAQFLSAVNSKNNDFLMDDFLMDDEDTLEQDNFIDKNQINKKSNSNNKSTLKRSSLGISEKFSSAPHLSRTNDLKLKRSFLGVLEKSSSAPHINRKSNSKLKRSSLGVLEKPSSISHIDQSNDSKLKRSSLDTLEKSSSISDVSQINDSKLNKIPTIILGKSSSTSYIDQSEITGEESDTKSFTDQSEVTSEETFVNQIKIPRNKKKSKKLSPILEFKKAISRKSPEIIKNKSSISRKSSISEEESLLSKAKINFILDMIINSTKEEYKTNDINELFKVNFNVIKVWYRKDDHIEWNILHYYFLTYTSGKIVFYQDMKQSLTKYEILRKPQINLLSNLLTYSSLERITPEKIASCLDVQLI